MKIVNDVIELSFYDLNGIAQQKFLKAMGLVFPSEGNYNILPIAVISIPEKETDNSLKIRDTDIEVFKLSDPNSVEKLHESLDKYFGR